MNADKQIEQPATSHDHRLKILKSRINRLLRKRPPLPLAELAHILLAKHRVGHTLPLIVQKLGVNPRAFLRRRADPLPLLAPCRPLRMKESLFAVGRAHQPQVAVPHRQPWPPPRSIFPTAACNSRCLAARRAASTLAAGSGRSPAAAV